MLRKLPTIAATVITLCAVCCSSHAASKGLSDKQKEHYSQVRKDFFVALALPPREGSRRLRKEHDRYLKSVTAFMKAGGEASAPHKAAALYFRARVLLRVRYLKHARKDLVQCLSVLESFPAADAKKAPGLPTEATIRVFHAFTFTANGADAVLKELEAIPEEAGKPRYFEVGDVMNDWADSLADADRIDEAMRAYTVIKKFDLWEEDYQHPDRKIELLKVRQSAANPYE